MTVGGPATILDQLRHPFYEKVRFFQPISSTVFGPTAAPQDEHTPLNPGSPYACAKAAAWLLCKHYRREHGLYVSCGVFFNHTSERQPTYYLLPKIASQAVEVATGKRERIELDGPDVVVDVGDAVQFVQAAWHTLQQDTAKDYVIGTGYGYRVSFLCMEALEAAGVRNDRFVIRDLSMPVLCNVANESDGPAMGATTVVRRLVRHYLGGK